MTFQELKINLAEWLLLKVKYPSEYVMGTPGLRRFDQYKGKKKIILTLIPSHDNLGDHAIALASRTFIENEFPDFELIEIGINDIYKHAKALMRIRHPEDMVFIIGGGNMGDLYRNEEWTRRFIIKTFKHYKIVQLPATAHFSETPRGKKELKRAKRIYNSHRRLFMMARDDTTYQFMKQHFSNQTIVKQPDMVLYLKKEQQSAREGVLVCLREDKESFLRPEERKKLLKAVGDEYGGATTFTTTIGRRVSRVSREKELNRLWDQLRGAEVVVTDRLHGMIFCAITGTPCVVIRSFDHKVLEGFRWLKDVPSLKLVENPDAAEVLGAIEELIKTGDSHRETPSRDHYFADLRQKIMGDIQ
ncbi:polysaccharide pyruvyl transferase family protein [Bacillus haynesii]|uniref:polysaccharide pyruvyl transferase family protein n=1 Tax=Bacillus haynesii TaxID=1925021 RepID=UPI002281CA81|nr:polysaccharide pyruvyl transferase family protein [Bacillus haynesii]MCY8214393.1 polysaccharide pyruvyl transferase family protein [Bacillus haynesii]MCY8610146.1 polysaccharide pyruvyl transferase family protein [Bacillus haynesii]MCY8666273.1 polysaccharide pyruvyl transferase family protein [Bacillus haynesii]MCY8710880.1 polysaccharide pyruvyl transferase family protein [Bacillus haynesii]MCY8738284.1 polysaccharide pyruvyl transferase family protein [Bacillus haynesii]